MSRAEGRPTVAEDIPLLLQTMQDPSSTPEDRLSAVRSIRQMLSGKRAPPVKPLLQSGALPILVRFLSYDKEPKLQFETAWAFTNVASTDHTGRVVEAGATQGLIRLMECPDANVREQAAWCLGNIAGDSPKLRDLVLTSGALPSIFRNIENPSSPSLLKNFVWLVSNLNRGKPAPELDLVRQCIPAMVYAIKHPMATNDSNIDALLALSYLTDGDDDRIQAVLQHPVVPLAMKALQSGKSSFTGPALRILGNVMTGNEKQAQTVIDAGIMYVIRPLLQSPLDCSYLSINREEKVTMTETSNEATGWTPSRAFFLAWSHMQSLLAIVLDTLIYASVWIVAIVTIFFFISTLTKLLYDVAHWEK